ncbi:MAG: hypothetical protein IT436_15170 [Phycisphaerales bacterium]|nr:hypothetical protein [Phycisphaerales bacterium]
MKAHLVQFDIAWQDREANLAKVNRLLTRAEVDPGDLILLPEMFDSGFSMDTARTADKEGRTLAAMSEIARDFDAYIQGGRTTQACDCALASNTATVVAPDGQVIDEYAKIKLFPLGQEPATIAPGRRVTTWHWETAAAALHVCPLICYDLRFPELFREGLRMGAEVYALGACWLEARHVHWKPLLVARAIENQAFVLAVNRTGRDPNSRYLGGSIAIGPKGEVLGELGEEEAVLSVEVEPREVRMWREKFPAWKDVISAAPGA